MSQADTHPPPEQFEAEPHTFTSLAAWQARVAEIAAATDAPFRIEHRDGVDFIISNSGPQPDVRRRRRRHMNYRAALLLCQPFTRRLARAFGRPRQHRRTRPSGTRGSPDGEPAGSSDDPEPPGLRVGPGSWQPDRVAEPPADVATPAKAVTE